MTNPTTPTPTPTTATPAVSPAPPAWGAGLVAWHGQPALKATYLARVEAHRAADELVQGRYWTLDDDGVWRGCAVGCTLETPGAAHAQYETELGIPRLLARLQDRIFEGLPREEAMAWPGRFLAAIPVGADLSQVWPRFAVQLLGDTDHGVIRHTQPGSRRHDAIVQVQSLYLQHLGGRVIDRQEWTAAAYAAYAADAAAYAAYAADAAADAAAYAAADAAADAAAGGDAAGRQYGWLAEQLLGLLAAAPAAAAAGGAVR